MVDKSYPAKKPDAARRVEEAQPAYQREYDPAAAGVRAVESLEGADFSQKQARGVVLTVRHLVGDLATKEDLTVAKSELRTEMAELKSELKADIAEFKSELRTEMAELKSELKTEIRDSIQKSIFWVVGLNFVAVLGVVGIAAGILIAVMQHMLGGG